MWERPLRRDCRGTKAPPTFADGAARRSYLQSFVAIARRRNTHCAVKNQGRTKVAVVGASGYTGEELVRLLLGHPHAELVAVTSRQFAGKTVAEIFPRTGHHSNAKTLKFADSSPAQIATEAEIIFLALPHGVAVDFAAPLLKGGARVIDLSADFRIKDAATYREFYGHEHAAPDLLVDAVYGLPEIYRDEIREARLIACPGCYPTSIFAADEFRCFAKNSSILAASS